MKKAEKRPKTLRFYLKDKERTCLVNKSNNSNGSWRKKTPKTPVGLFNTHPEAQNPPLFNGKKKPTGGTVITARMKQSASRTRSHTRRILLGAQRAI
jgi:hypothetical protein